jgi:hypothetical protein
MLFLMMESEFVKIIYAKINGIPWQPQIAKFVSSQKKQKQTTGYTVSVTLSICKQYYKDTNLVYITKTQHLTFRYRLTIRFTIMSKVKIKMAFLKYWHKNLHVIEIPPFLN